MSPLPSFYRMGMDELNRRILDLYPRIDQRKLVISVPPNSYGKADYIYIDHHGSPPKGGAIYDKAHRRLFMLSVGLNTKRTVGVNVVIEPLDSLEVGFYSWYPGEGFETYRGGSL